MIRKTLVLVVLAIVLSPQAVAGKGKSPFPPGPLGITPEEAAIVADPEAGIEHGVYLVKRTARDELQVGAEVESRHVRAKILSNEGRDLANVEVPLPDDAKLREWWGRTLLPDGTVLELPRSDLEEATVVEGGGVEYRVLKAALPGVVPGCVVEFGWSVKKPWVTSYRRVPIQTDWPIRSFTYRWRPPMRARAAFRLYRVDGLDVTGDVQGREIVVTAHDMPPVVDEPLMPADQLVRASVVFYHLPSDAGLDDYWDSASRALARWKDSLIGSKKQRRLIVEQLELPADGTVEQKMRAAYDWVGDNLTRTDVRTFEEIEAGVGGGGGRSKSLVVDAMRDREGSRFALQLVLLAVAEELGVSAHIVLAADRTDWLFDRHLRSARQIDATFAAVDVAGNGSVFLLDPGSGLAFGDIPWRYSGSMALLPTKDGAMYVGLPFLGAGNSGSRHDVDLEILEEDDLLVAKWTATRFGQEAFDTRIAVRRLAPEDRQDRLHEMCGVASDREIIEATPERLELGGDFLLRCVVELPLPFRGGRDRRELDWRGPWLREPPELPDAPRIHPIEFNFPRSDKLVIRVEPPDGFVAIDPPPVEQFETQYGGYSFAIAREGDGYTIARHLYILSTTVDPEEYVALREFFERVRQADRTGVKFRRNAAP